MRDGVGERLGEGVTVGIGELDGARVLLGFGALVGGLLPPDTVPVVAVPMGVAW